MHILHKLVIKEKEALSASFCSYCSLLINGSITDIALLGIVEVLRRYRDKLIPIIMNLNIITLVALIRKPNRKSCCLCCNISLADTGLTPAKHLDNMVAKGCFQQAGLVRPHPKLKALLKILGPSWICQTSRSRAISLLDSSIEQSAAGS